MKTITSSCRALARAVSLLAALLVADGFQAQGQLPSLRITFDGPPFQPPGTAYVVGQYAEAGMLFKQGTSGRMLARCGGGIPFFPENGTAYLVSDNPYVPIVCYFPDVGPPRVRSVNTVPKLFSLRSVDLAEYSTVVPNAVKVRFIGYRLDGTTVVAERTTDGIIDGTGPIADFQTFSFQGFSSISRLEIFAGGASIDNLVVRVGPDLDDDGVADTEDQCSDTPPGAVVNEHGCSIDQLVPCDGPAAGGTWRNHGQYVSAMAATANDFLTAGLITADERDARVQAAAHSNCGKK